MSTNAREDCKPVSNVIWLRNQAENISHGATRVKHMLQLVMTCCASWASLAQVADMSHQKANGDYS